MIKRNFPTAATYLNLHPSLRDGDGAALRQEVFSRRHSKQLKKTLPRTAASVQSKTPTSNMEVRRNEGETEKYGFSATLPTFWSLKK
jgi:hypothetical protein